jgi:hypothetical protein
VIRKPGMGSARFGSLTWAEEARGSETGHGQRAVRKPGMGKRSARFGNRHYATGADGGMAAPSAGADSGTAVTMNG